jgi:hypothetical protein
MGRVLPLTLVTFAALSGLAVCGKAPSTLTLSWNPPITDTSGDPLTNLKGYRIVFGTSSKHYTGAILVKDPKATHYAIKGLAPGRYYFAISALSATGAESSVSPEVTGVVK